eukprot:m.105833 g.105833  ORF g.105833 m.105833 type:complete len:152 (-) comp9139_c9_seq13:133-588(-)
MIHSHSHQYCSLAVGVIVSVLVVLQHPHAPKAEGFGVEEEVLVYADENGALNINLGGNGGLVVNGVDVMKEINGQQSMIASVVSLTSSQQLAITSQQEMLDRHNNTIELLSFRQGLLFSKFYDDICIDVNSASIPVTASDAWYGGVLARMD